VQHRECAAPSDLTKSILVVASFLPARTFTCDNLCSVWLIARSALLDLMVARQIEILVIEPGT
jgi:hypothetical protein